MLLYFVINANYIAIDSGLRNSFVGIVVKLNLVILKFVKCYIS